MGLILMTLTASPPNGGDVLPRDLGWFRAILPDRWLCCWPAGSAGSAAGFVYAAGTKCECGTKYDNAGGYIFASVRTRGIFKPV